MRCLAGIKNFFNTLTGRIVLGGLAVHALLTPLLYISVIYLVKESFESKFVDRVRLDSHLIAESIDYAETPALIGELLADLTADKQYVFAELVALHEKTGSAATVKNTALPFREDRHFGQHGDNVFYIAVPLPSNHLDGVAYLLRLGYNEKPIVEDIQNIKWLCFYLTVGYVLLILLSSFIFGPLITHPLRSLRKDAREIASGSYDHPLGVNTSISEISSLVTDFETMRQELVRHNRELEYQSLHDALTGLPNRVLLLDRLRQALLSAQREDRLLALLMIDLDGFKAINDTLGHHYGDLLLQQVSSRIAALLRKSDTIARFGGDEFCIILPTIRDSRHAAEIANKIIGCLDQPFFFENRPYTVGMSIGIAIFPQHGVDSALLMRHADVAMYIAKNNNLDYTLYDAAQDKNSLGRLSLMWDLRHAIEQGELHLVYQPIVNFEDGGTETVEALVRWHHPRRGLIMPHDFITLTEQANLIKPLTRWVLSEAARQCCQWQKQGYDLRVAINLSPRSLHDREHPRQLMKIIDDFNLPPGKLMLELTESAIISDPVSTQAILQQFHQRGIMLAIDDFGTGYSSLSSLQKLPLDIIKIDQSFIADMLANTDNGIIVKSTIDLAHNMGLQVIAEGVVSAEIWQMLQQLECDQAQGYYISKPLLAQELTAWLDDADKIAVN